MKLSDFEYELPEERIAQSAAEPRDSARLFVHRIATDASEHAHVRDLGHYLSAGDLLVLNDTRVLPSRLFGRRASGGKLELLLLEPSATGAAAVWRALVRPGARMREGERVELEGGALAARLLRRLEGPEWEVEIELGPADACVEDLLERHGRMPLPPYIQREAGDVQLGAKDRERYQTVYARERGAAAAPTAGLHFTPELLAALEARGVELAHVTLHVGLGTFQPVAVERIEDHAMHSERYVLPEATQRAVRAARLRGGRVFAVGTTSVRVLETCAAGGGLVHAARGETRIFLKPGDRLQVVDGLLTNFHLPRSTLLMLVSALAGRERVLRLYAEALAASYRFFSYGDAMLFLP
ncbi:MAG: tRNA preQ1(34) S-adenosylmethionine ribosyltransferase-isomerase QueA [Planctomycetes bacterium]|nr:tRNA preQ1(34) S-adenosylmethionine ribosyltransferase-isomerase QueA [Planctomycetota bacterium]